MPKKIFDIIPPKNHKKKSTVGVPERSIDIDEESFEIEEKPLSRIPAAKIPKKKRGFFFKFFVGLVVIVILALVPFVILSFQSKMSLTLQFAQEDVSFQEEVEVDVNQEVADMEAKIIPGKIFEIEEGKWETFPATGKDFEGKKAEGVITVFNAHTPPTPVSLIVNTRFLSSQDGKTFIAPERIYIAAAQIKNGKTIPGSKEVKVEAQEEGEDYNIGPSKFSLPGLLGGALYYSVWGESTEAMTGGVKKEIKKVTKEDLEEAKKLLQQRLVELAATSLKKEITQGFVLEEKTVFEKNSEVSCFQEPEAKVDDFTCEGKIEAGGLVFKKADLEELTEQHFLNNIPPEKKLYRESLTLEFSPKRIEAEQGKMSLNLVIKGKIYADIPREAFVSQIQGKSQEDIKRIILEDYPQIAKAEFRFWPFWIKRAPKALERIEIDWKF